MIESMLVAIATMFWLAVACLVLVIVGLPAMFALAWAIAGISWLLYTICKPIAWLIGYPFKD